MTENSPQDQKPPEPPKKTETTETPKTTPKSREKILRRVYFQIVEGFTPAEIDGDKLWIKHFDLPTQTRIDQYYNEVYERAEKKGLITEVELLKRLRDDGLWTKEEEDFLKERTRMLEGLRTTVSKAVNNQMKEIIEGNIAEAEKELHEHKEKKASLLENTCEQLAERRSSDMIVRLSFYKEDKDELYFSEEDFDLLDRSDLSRLVGVYNVACQDLTGQTVKEIAAAEFFSTYYSIVDTAPHQFFEKEVFKWTFFQVNLLSYAKIFSAIVKNLSPPDHIRSDPDKLLAFAKSQSKKRDAEDRKAKRTSHGPQTLGGN